MKLPWSVPWTLNRSYPGKILSTCSAWWLRIAFCASTRRILIGCTRSDGRRNWTIWKIWQRKVTKRKRRKESKRRGTRRQKHEASNRKLILWQSQQILSRSVKISRIRIGFKDRPTWQTAKNVVVPQVPTQDHSPQAANLQSQWPQ